MEPLEEAESPGLGDPQDDEVALFEEFARTQSPDLQEQIVLRYSRLVVSLVKKFRGRAEWEDLVQVGYLGLLKAVNGYKPSSGFRFSTYASHCVSGELRHYLRDRTEVVRRPRWLQAVSRKVGSFVEAFLHKHERLPTIGEVSEGCNIAREGVVEVLRAGGSVSLEQMQAEGRESFRLGKLKSLREESFVLSLEDRIWIETALERLVEAEKRILKMFFFRDLNQSQIAGETGLTPKSVSRLMRKALARLQGFMRLNEGESDG